MAAGTGGHQGLVLSAGGLTTGAAQEAGGSCAGPRELGFFSRLLAEVAEHPKTTIQVIRSGGAHAGLLAHFVIADLDSKPPVVYLDRKSVV